MENELLAPKDHFSKQSSKEECPSITTQTTQRLTTVTIESKNPSQPIPAMGDSVTKAVNRPVPSFTATGTRDGETPGMELENRGL
jgi:hypothetical protein